MLASYQSYFGRYRLKASAVFFAIHIVLLSAAQPGGYEMVAHYSNDNGLPQNSVLGLLQDTNGFVWITTHGGIVRFDGQNLKTFNTTTTAAMGRNNSYGNMRLHGGHLEIAPSLYSDNILVVKNGKTISTNPAQNDTVYCKTLSNEFTSFDDSVPAFLKELRPIVASQKERKQEGLWYTVIAWPGRQNGYFRTEDGDIWYYDGKTGKLCCKNVPEIIQYFLLGDTLYFWDGNNRLLAWHKGIATAGPKGSLAQLLQQSNTAKPANVQFIGQGAQVFLKLNEALYLIVEEQGRINARLLTPHLPVTDIARIIYLQREKLLIIGSATSGMYVLQRKMFQTLRYEYPEGYTHYFAPNSLYAVAPMNDSTLLTTTGTLSTQNKSKVYASNLSIDLRSFVRSAHGTVLLGLSGTVVQTNDAFGAPKCITGMPKGNIKSYFFDGNILYLAVDSQLLQLDYKAGNFSNVRRLSTLSGKSIISMAPKNGQEILLGTLNGLYVYDKRTHKTELVPALGNNTIRALYTSKNGINWIATDDEGWYRHGLNGISKMPIDQKGYLARIHAFAEDRSGYLWMSTNNGMFRFLYDDAAKYKPADGKLFYNYFDKSYGSLTSEYNGNCSPAMAILKDGAFVFPSIQGLVHFYPDSIVAEQPDWPLVLEDVYVDTGRLGGENPVLDPGFNSLALHVATPFYGHLYNLQLEYQLSGGANTWTSVDKSGDIRFNRLPPGNYTLSIRKLSGYGKKEESKIDFSFTVNAYWYQSFAFWALMAGVATLSIIIYIRQKAKISTRQQKILEERVAHRTQQLKKTLEELGDTVVELETSQARLKQITTFREQVTSLVLHDIRSPLLYLNAITENIHASSLNATPGTLTQKLYDLHLGVKEISAHAHQLLMWITIQQDSFNLKKSMVSIYGLLKQTTATYQALATQKGISIYFTADENLCFFTQPDLVEIVLRNLVDNAIKFTETGSIHVSATPAGNDIRISVADTGTGMTDAFVKKLLSNAGNYIQGNKSGLGYRFIQDVLNKIDGQLNIESVPGTGTTVTVTLLTP